MCFLPIGLDIERIEVITEQMGHREVPGTFCS